MKTLDTWRGPTSPLGGPGQVAEATDRIEVTLLGGLQVKVGEVALGPRQLGGTKPRQVLLALLLNDGVPVPKERLVSMLWDERPSPSAVATLETYICVLRKKLQPGDSARTSLITTTAGCYRIDMSRVDLDLARYTAAVARALHPSTPAAEALSELRLWLPLASRALLPEEGSCEWIEQMRQSHAQSVNAHLTDAAFKVAEVAPADALRWATLALEGDPLHEPAWRAYLLAKEVAGEYADGLRAYDRCRRLFATELGCDPGPRLQDAYMRLLRGAHEGDATLTRLFDAVVSLYGSAGTVSPGRPEAEHALPAVPRRGSLEQAWSMLDALVRQTGGLQPQLNGRASA